MKAEQHALHRLSQQSRRMGDECGVWLLPFAQVSGDAEALKYVKAVEVSLKALNTWASNRVADAAGEAGDNGIG